MIQAELSYCSAKNKGCPSWLELLEEYFFQK